MQPVTVVIADDHQMVREGLKQLLELDEEIQVIGQAGDGKECIALIAKYHPDIVLLDINMPNMNGLETLKLIRKEYKSEKVLMLTIHNEIDYLIKSMELGANGYILKDSEFIVLKKAILTILNGGVYIEPSLKPEMTSRMEAKNSTLHNEVLTRREIEVLRLLAEGLFNKEIAAKLCISEKTVKNHVSSIFKKIGVSDRTQAAVYAIKNYFITTL